ncbi:MAG: carbohydrate-binding family 9-like protein [Myxococcales bacterium]|nr:carbohydrate-binding family 9-like protein [Myxococcales bacterium]
MPKPAIVWGMLALAVAATSCKRAPSFDEPFVDRSDGAMPELSAPKIPRGAIRVDGKLDEPEWVRAGSSGMFVAPGSGRPAPQSKVNARARLAWDDERLYVAFVVWDAQPSSPFGKDAIDPHIWARASGVELMLQPGNRSDNRDYFEIQVDVAGSIWDTRFDDYNRPITGGPDDASKRFGHQDWRSELERAVVVGSGSYVIELAIPLRALGTAAHPSPPRAGDVWRANLYSFRDGQADALAWSPLLGQGNFHRAARFGRLVFAAGTP